MMPPPPPPRRKDTNRIFAGGEAHACSPRERLACVARRGPLILDIVEGKRARARDATVVVSNRPIQPVNVQCNLYTARLSNF